MAAVTVVSAPDAACAGVRAPPGVFGGVFAAAGAGGGGGGAVQDAAADLPLQDRGLHPAQLPGGQPG